MTETLKICPPKIVTLLYQLIYDVHKILRSHEIPYWANGGTLLGAIRHSGIIPWDDDLDIGMMKKDQNRFLDLKNVFKKCGYSIVKVWFGFKIFYTNRDFISGFNYSYPNLDIFMYHIIHDRYELYYKKARDTWPNEYWYETDLYPLRDLPFGDLHISCPHKYKEYFERMYGKDWNKIAYRQYDHENEELLSSDKIKVKLTPSMRQPAKPTSIIERKCTEYCISKIASPVKWIKKLKSLEKCSHNFNRKIGVYVINCDMHIDRLKKFNKYANNAGLKVCRIPCILGKKFTTEELCKMIDDGIISKRANMTPIEISINMSHYNCWKSLVDSKLEYALICEDDIEVKSSFVKDVNSILDALEIDFSILHLWNGNWNHTKSKMKNVIKINEKLQIMKETVPYNAGATCYIISKKYARFLMDHFFPIRRPQDIFMASFINKTHLSLKMKFDKDKDCYISPILDMPCGGDGGTGKTTQNYTLATIDTYSCKKC